MGDFNINNLFCNNFQPCIHHPTRISDNSSTVIDNIFTNVTAIILSGNILTQISDHLPQFLILKNKSISHFSSKSSIYDYSSFDETNFINDFRNIDFSYLNNSLNIELSYDAFLKDITELVDRHVPSRKCTRKELRFRNKPWINKRIQKMIKIRDRIFKKLKNDKSLTNKTLYKKFRSRVATELKRSKIQYFQDYFSSNISNAKKLWSGIKSIISNKNQISNKINGIRDKNGNMISNSEEISNVFNNYFVNVADNIEKAIPRTSKSPMDYLKTSNPYSMFLSPTTKLEVEDVISNLDSTKSIGPNSIPIKLLKVLKPYISQYLEKLVNQSFLEGHFPSKLRSAKVIALFKKGNSELASNYRPISLLPLFSKVFERIMYNKLYTFLTANNILYPLQFGFQKDRAIDHALIGMTEMIRLTLDNKRFGCGIFVDLQKAFDTVNHNILIAKLEHYGVRGNVLQWFKSYLYDRDQYVSINGTSSTPLRVTSGVPQGSVLGPLLFLIFINDMPNASKKLKFYIFADDTSIYYESETLNEMITRVNKELKLVKKWLNANKLFLNIDKTNYVTFHSTQIKIPPDVRIKIGNKILKRAKYFKFLGILLDEYLNRKHHITELSKKLSRACGILFKIRNFLPSNLLIDVYNSLFVLSTIWNSSIGANICLIY